MLESNKVEGDVQLCGVLRLSHRNYHGRGGEQGDVGQEKRGEELRDEEACGGCLETLAGCGDYLIIT